MKIAAAFAVLAALASACAMSDSRTAPAFALRTLDGKTVSLGQESGKVVLVNFWASWCDPCREEFPALQELQRRRAADGFTVLAVSVDDDVRAVSRFLGTHPAEFPVLLADPATKAAYRVRDLPTSFLIAPDGSIARRYVGPVEPSAVENDILTLLNRRSS